MVKKLPEMQVDPGLIPGSGRHSGEENDYTLQYFCLRISWTKEPGRQKLMGLQRVRHN